jgi:pyruvate formate lyase activating enzyme
MKINAMTTRKEFITASVAFAVAPLFAGGRAVKTPLMLDTKRMAIYDGPGIRTTFFVKGCPLRCIWCHNPESISAKPQTARFRHLCRCCAKCTMDEATCPTKALKFYGKPMSIDAIVAKAMEDKAFYDESGGGVTLSGGEPLFFWEWAAELFKALKAKGLHTCLDTSLYAPPAAIEALLPLTDMWLADYKAEDDALHQKYTGVSNRVIKKNLERILATGAKTEVRCLVVPGCTDGDDLEARRRYLSSLGIAKTGIVELEYNDYARSKYLALGLKDTMPPKVAGNHGSMSN